jgi:hypothetical protein
MALRVNRRLDYGYLACTNPQPALGRLSGAAKYPAGARPSKCIIIIILLLFCRWGSDHPPRYYAADLNFQNEDKEINRLTRQIIRSEFSKRG